MNSLIWHSYKTNLPPLGEEVLAFNPKWKDADYNPTGVCLGYRCDDGFVHAKWDNDQDMWWPINSEYDKSKEACLPKYWIEKPTLNIK